jgi:hypothetical protein
MKYRVAGYYDGNNKFIWRPEWRLPWIPLWFRFTDTDCYSWWVVEFELLTKAEEWLKNHVDRREAVRKGNQRKFVCSYNYE